MSHKKIWRWLLAAVIIVILVSPLFYWSTGVGQSAAELSAAVTRQPDGALVSSPKAQALHRLSLPIRLERMLVYPLLLLAFQFSGGAIALRQYLEIQILRLSERFPRFASLLNKMRRPLPQRWREKLSGQTLMITLLFILAIHLLIFFLYLPFNFYQSFILGRQFGLLTQNIWGWFSDWTKGVLLSLATDGLLWTGFYSLILLFPRRWPIPGGVLLVLASLIFTLLTPILITPLFYEVKPLEDAQLRERILTLTQRLDTPITEVYVIDASTKTTQVNAYVDSFGQAQRIVLYDTLLASYSPDEVEVILAHELGHWLHHHVLLGIVGMGAAGWLGLFGLRWLLNHTWRKLRLRGPADVAGLPFLLAILSIAVSLSLPFQNGISRYAERQADEFALAVSQKPAVFMALFERLAEQNLSIVDPPDWEEIIFYTHPPTAERIRRAESLQLQSLSDQQ